MEAPEIGAYVNRDNVPLLEDPVPGNPMDHRVVDGNAGAGGESAIMQERRPGALLHDKIVYGLVNLPGGDAGLTISPAKARLPR